MFVVVAMFYWWENTNRFYRNFSLLVEDFEIDLEDMYNNWSSILKSLN
jgi:hypothetical protein